jgi:hypothetical protein
VCGRRGTCFVPEPPAVLPGAIPGPLWSAAMTCDVAQQVPCKGLSSPVVDTAGYL